MMDTAAQHADGQSSALPPMQQPSAYDGMDSWTWRVFMGVAAAAGLYATRLYNYLLFHSLTELLCIAIAFTILILVYNSRWSLDNDFLKLLGTGYVWAGCIDLIHTLAFKGMPIFIGYTANLPTQLWIAARSLQALTLLAAPFAIRRKLHFTLLQLIYASVTVLLVWSAFSGVFPECYREGSGLTTFKVFAEYVIVIIILTSMYLLRGVRESLSGLNYRLMLASYACTVCAELSFTAYLGVYDAANMAGHYFKLLAYYFLYRAIFVSSIRDPLDTLLRSLKQSNINLENMVEERTNELRSSEEKYRSLVENITECIWETDHLGRFTYLSPAFRNLTGYAPDDFLGKTPLDIICDDGNPEQIHQDVAAVLSARKPFPPVECPFRDRDGHLIFVEVSISHVFGADGEYLGMRGITRDVTARKQAEEKLRVSEDNLRRAQTVAMIGSWVVDLENGNIRRSDEACRILGVPSQHEASLTEALDLVHPDDREHVREQWQSSHATGEPFAIEHRIVVNGDITWVREVAEFARDGKGRVVSCLGTTQDITVLKRNELELIGAREAADAANRAKSEFLANMSHEIRTPLNGIYANAQLLKYTSMDDDQIECLDNIMKSSDGLLSIINDILDLSKIEAGKVELEEREFSISACVGDVIKTQYFLIHRKGLSIRTSIDPDVPDNVRCDQLRLKQILLNILGNAIKFTDKGEIRIHVSMAERHGAHGKLLISVRDTGIGISPEAMEKIFKPFSQEDASTTRQYGGTGLGLSICARLVSLMGGCIRAESEKGIGSAFFVEIPVSVREAEPAPRTPERTGGIQDLWDGPSLRILLADDTESGRKVAFNVLTKAGHEVVTATDGVEALGLLKKERFDMALMDVQMPVMNGIEATRAIRDREKGTGRHMPVIAMTARVLREERERILGQGFDGFISKPYVFAELFNEISNLFPEQPRRTAPEDAALPPAGGEPRGAAMDKARLDALLNEMELLLRSHNTVIVIKIHEFLKDIPPSESVRELREHVKRFDFEKALNCLDGIRAEYATAP